MLRYLNRIPAGTFLVPLLISALLYTFFPDLLAIGGLTEAFFGGTSVNFIIGALTFFSGIGIDVKSLGKLLKRHGVILLVKLILSIILSLLFISIFGQDGILGISALAFTVAMSSANPAVYISIVNDLGDEVDQGAFGLVGLFGIPAVPLLIYGFTGSGGFDWSPVISTLIPLIVGIILGNLDSGFKKLFGSGVSVLIPVLGWNLGQGMNLLDVASSGVIGILLLIIYYIFMSVLVATDKYVLKNDGMPAMAMNAVSASAAAYPAIVAAANPSAQPYVSSAAAQILTLAIITIVVTPILSRKVSEQSNK